MGIQGLKSFIKKHAPDAFITVPITKFSGKRIAIDSNNWIHTKMSAARKKVIMDIPDLSIEQPDQHKIQHEWLCSIVNFVLKLLSYNVTPVFIFDGSHPPEKKAKQNKSKEEREKLKHSIDELYSSFHSCLTDEDRQQINLTLKKKLCNYVTITNEEHIMVKKLIKGLGLPFYIAIGDGERLCSSLCYEEQVAASFSADIDNLVYRCPLTITNLSKSKIVDNGISIPQFDCIRLDKVLLGLNMSHATFVDLSIMTGCDYNTNIKGYAVVRSFNLLKNVLSIDNLPSNLDISCLNHFVCRDLFSYKTSKELTSPDCNGVLDIDKSSFTTLSKTLSELGIGHLTSNVISVYHSSLQGANGLIDDLELQLVPHYVIQRPSLYLNILTPQPTIKLNILPLPN